MDDIQGLDVLLVPGKKREGVERFPLAGPFKFVPPTQSVCALEEFLLSF